MHRSKCRYFCTRGSSACVRTRRALTHSFQKMPKKAAVATYEPEKVVGSRGSGKNIEYEVKWVGYKSSENTWEPPANLASCKEVPACHPPSHAVGTRV